MQLSLQPSKGGKWGGQAGAQQAPKADKVAAVTTLDKLKEGAKVRTHSLDFRQACWAQAGHTLSLSG